MKKKLIFITLLFFLIVPIVSLADFDIKKWHYEKEIIIKEEASYSNYILFNFDEQVFANAKLNLADIRVIAEDFKEIPYKLLVEKEYYSREFRPVKILNLSFIPEEYQFFIIDFQRSGVLHNQIKILTTSINFRREVTIEGSDNQEDWFILNDKSHIYDYSPPQFEFKQQGIIINYPESTYRYLRVKIISKGEDPLKITGAEAYRQVTTAARRLNYPVNIIDQTTNKESNISFIILDLGSVGLPSNSLRINTADTNFSREIALEGSNDSQSWQVVDRRNAIFSLSTPKFTGSKLNVDYPESNFRYLKLTIFNKDDRPISITDISVSGILRKVLFKYDPANNYKLYYGNPAARYPQYDIEAIFPYLEIKDLPQVALGAQTNNVYFEEVLPPPPPFTERYSWLLMLVLAAIVLILLWLVIRLILEARRSQIKK